MNDSDSERAKRLFGPDLIRATAILCVVLSHTFPGATMFAAVRAVRGVLGYLGVEIFFVLSGYLIGGILLRELFDGALHSARGLAVFWKRRWFRTLPNYYLFLLLNAALFLYLDGRLAPGTWKFLWFGEALASEHPRFFNVAWSLAVEEWFYLTFPLLLWLGTKALKSRSLAFWATVALFLVVPFGLRCSLTFGNWDGGLRKVTFFRLDAIMFGVILAFLRERAKWWEFLLRLWPIGVAGLAGLIAYLVTTDMSTDSFFDRALVFEFTSLSLAFVFPSVIALRPPRNVLETPIRKISLWSYSMYLVHPWVGTILWIGFGLAGWSDHGFNALALSLLTWMATLSASALIYSFYEKPLMDLRERSLMSLLIPRRAQRGSEAKLSAALPDAANASSTDPTPTRRSPGEP